MSKKIAIVGAGLAGLSLSHFLARERQNLEIHVFDEREIGQGTSGLAAGLLHPFSAASARLSPQGLEAQELALSLIRAIEKESGQRLIASEGILRVALDADQEDDFARSAQTYGLPWWSKEHCQEMCPGIAARPGLFLPSAVTVDCSTYVKSLWHSCLKKGVTFIQAKVSPLSLEGFDSIILAAGASLPYLIDNASLRIGRLKGQLLEYEWPEDISPLPFSINSKAYLVANGPKTCLAGATFERSFESEEACEATAFAQLHEKVSALFPALATAKIISCRAGIRATTPNRQPLWQKISPKTWIFGGFGSKGLLYHALYAKRAAAELLI